MTEWQIETYIRGPLSESDSRGVAAELVRARQRAATYRHVSEYEAMKDARDTAARCAADYIIEGNFKFAVSAGWEAEGFRREISAYLIRKEQDTATAAAAHRASNAKTLGDALTSED
jgi:hypothetical protein